jgi:hypothetical protein
MSIQTETRIKELCARAVQLPDSSPELKGVILELQTVLREQTAGIRALAAEGIMSRPEVGPAREPAIAGQEDQPQNSTFAGESATPRSEREIREVKPVQNLFNSILRLVLQNPE